MKLLRIAGAALLVVLAPAGVTTLPWQAARPTRQWRPPAAEHGVASWYGVPFHGRLTASGEPFNMHAMTAASRTLPLGAVVEVVCGERSVVVEITDRGPYIAGRIIDLSFAAAQKLDIVQQGIAAVEVFAAKNTKEE